MEIIYASRKIELECADMKSKWKKFGGDKVIIKNLESKLNALKEATTIKDIIALPTYRFHNLHNKDGRNLDGYFAIDVKTRKEPWRIILQPLNENIEPYNPCRIDEIAESVKRIRIMEVSRHYE